MGANSFGWKAFGAGDSSKIRVATNQKLSLRYGIPLHSATVGNRRNHIMRRFAARNVIELVERAIQMGLVKLPPHRIRGGDRREPPKSAQKRT